MFYSLVTTVNHFSMKCETSFGDFDPGYDHKLQQERFKPCLKGIK